MVSYSREKYPLILAVDPDKPTDKILTVDEKQINRQWLIKEWKLNNLSIGFVGASLRSKAGKMPAQMY